MPLPAFVIAAGSAISAAAPVVLAKTAAAVAIAAPIALTGVKAIAQGGGVVNNWLKEKCPLPSDSAETEEFPPLPEFFSDNKGYKIKLLKEAAVTLGTADAVYRTRGVIEQINEKTFTLLFVGKFNAGKSSLLNKILGRDILKTGKGETTKILTCLMGKDEEAAYYHDYLSDSLHGIPLDDVKNIPEDPPVSAIVACVNNDILKHNAYFIDTPGMYASEETAKLTREMLKTADAVVLVVDHFPEDVNDNKFIEDLKFAGKGDRLIIAMNKMEKLSPEKRSTRIEKRKAWLNGLGIRADIYPLSYTHKLDAIDKDFNDFRAALEEYLKTGLQKAKDAGIEQRIKNTAAELRDMCRDTVGFAKEENINLINKTRTEVQAWKKEFDENVKKILQANRREILYKRESVKSEWGELYGRLKGEVSVKIQKATDGQLYNLNQLFEDVQAQIKRFLINKFHETEDQIRDNLNKLSAGLSFNDANLPVPQRAGQMSAELVRWDKTRIPAEFASMGLLAYTLITKTTQGIFAAIGSIPQLFLIFTLSPLINKVFAEIQEAGGKIATSVLKSKLQERINTEWPGIDKNVQNQIDAYFDELLKQSDRIETIGNKNGKNVFDEKINAAESFRNGNRISELEKLKEQLDIASK
ncbi:MAG: dynamin family protein [Treponema sp.]|jgi:GTPase Era involved in 16S rRNA processing|nr:dynamin family protein [Treponema sp.]